jgi:outer membrane PBP1 activator LpoA protein
VQRQLLVMAIVLNCACQVTPTAPGGETTAGTRPVASRTSDREAQRDAIRGAEEAITAGALDRAATLLDAIDSRRLDGPLRFEFAMATAELALARGDSTRAGELHAALLPSTSQQRRDAGRLAARIAAAQGRYADAAETLMSLPSRDSAEERALSEEIWSFVARTPPYSVATLRQRARNEIVAGWWALADAVLQSFDLSAQQRNIVAWQQLHPAHPAARHLPRELAAGQSPLAATPRRIALLLPLTGPLAAAGGAVRDGFVAAFFHGGSESVVHVYDSAGADFPAIHEQIVADRMDVIVGPLDKSTLAAANAYAGRTLPMLALNYLTSGEVPGPDLIQFGLAIEDEARAIGVRLGEDRIGRVAIFSTPDDWSQRAALELRTVLAGSDTLLVVDTLVDDPRRTPDTVGAALLVDGSMARKAEIESIVGTKLEFVARRRDDVQAVVALTDSAKARSLLPALAFHFAGDLPVYGTSTLVQGASRATLREFEGARVTELPWRVHPDPVRDAVTRALTDVTPSLEPLYALGADAYRIVARLGTPATTGIGGAIHLLGSTGVLTLDAEGAFRREPVWAIVRRGTLTALPILVQ